MNQINDVKLPVVSHGQRSGCPRRCRGNIEVIGPRTSRDDEIGSLAIRTDIFSGNFRDLGRKLHGRDSIVFFDVNPVDFALCHPVFHILVLQADFFRRRLFSLFICECIRCDSGKQKHAGNCFPVNGDCIFMSHQFPSLCSIWVYLRLVIRNG